jgi:hypothetical protein
MFLAQTATAGSLNKLNKHTLTQTATAGSLNKLNKHTLTQTAKVTLLLQSV